MRTLSFDLADTPTRPLFLRLTDAIITAIGSGRLKPGDRLPGTRSLAETMGLHRNTVDAAYREAIAQGWLATEPSRGTYVATALPETHGIPPMPSSPLRSATANPSLRQSALLRAYPNPMQTPAPAPAPIPIPASTPTQPAVQIPVEAQSLLHLSDGIPDPRLMPGAELARAFRRALKRPEILAPGGYGDPRGLPALRTALQTMLAVDRGLSPHHFDLMVTRGSQMALFLAAGALVPAGDSIAVENPGYPQAVDAFRAAGARIVSVPVDSGGLDTDALEVLLRRDPSIRALYATPHHQYPTTVTLGAARRMHLLDLLRRYRLTLIEDDYDHDFRFDGKPVLPLAARAETDLSIVYVGSLSKVLAPSLRVGYVAAPPPVLARMAEHRSLIDRQGDLPLEAALATLMTDGEVGRHARKARRIYQTRRDHLISILEHTFGDALAVLVPAGGLALWVTVADGTSARHWADRAAAIGLMIRSGDSFRTGTGPVPEAFRIGFAALDTDDMRRAIALLARSRPHLRG